MPSTFPADSFAGLAVCGKTGCGTVSRCKASKALDRKRRLGNGYLKLRMIALLTSTKCTIVPVMSEVFGDQRCKALSYLHLRNFLPYSRTNESGLQVVYPEAVALRHVMTQW